MKNDIRLRRLVMEAVNEAIGEFGPSQRDGLLQIVRPMVTSVRSVFEKLRDGMLLDDEVQQFCMYCQRFDSMYRKMCREYEGSEA